MLDGPARARARHRPVVAERLRRARRGAHRAATRARATSCAALFALAEDSPARARLATSTSGDVLVAARGRRRRRPPPARRRAEIRAWPSSAGAPAARRRPRARRGARIAAARASGRSTLRVATARGRHRQPALLPAARLPHALRRTRRLHRATATPRLTIDGIPLRDRVWLDSTWPAVTDAELYRRGVATLLASWEEYARGRRRRRGLRAAAASPRPCSRASPSAPSTTTRCSTRPRAGRARRGRRRDGGRLRAPPASTRYAAWVHESDDGDARRARARAATRSTRRRGRWAWRSTTSRLPRPELELGPPDWPEYLRILGARRAGLPAAAPTGRLPRPGRPRSTARTSRPRWPSTTTATAASSTSDPGARPAARARHGADRPALHDARDRGCRRRACSRRRWPSASTPPSASATSAGSSSTRRQRRAVTHPPPR